MIKQMDNIGHIRTYEVTIVNLSTNNAAEMAVQSGEDMSTGQFVIWCNLDNQEIVSAHDEYFTAFQQFRDKLLEAGYGIKCNGARLNAAPLSKFENGPQVYILESDSSALPESSVDIWAKADIEDFPDSVRQNRFKNKWYDEHMGVSKQNSKFSKLCLSGFIFSIMPLVLYILCTLFPVVFGVLLASLIISPLLGIILSIAGLVTAGRKGKKGKGFGIAGIALPVTAVIIFSITLGPIFVETSKTAKRLAQDEMYALGYMGETLNTEYDISQYRIPEGYDFNSLNITVSDAELEAYGESKLEKIDTKTDNSIRGVFQTYNFLIVRSDKLDTWLESNSRNGFEYNNGYASISYLRQGMEWMVLEEPLAVYKDPSDKFIVITNCGDYKVITEFFD